MWLIYWITYIYMCIIYIYPMWGIFLFHVYSETFWVETFLHGSLKLLHIWLDYSFYLAYFSGMEVSNFQQVILRNKVAFASGTKNKLASSVMHPQNPLFLTCNPTLPSIWSHTALSLWEFQWPNWCKCGFTCYLLHCEY